MAALLHDDALGKVLAQRYRLDEQLGRGAMGTVYRGRDLATLRPVAVKVLHAGLASDPGIIERFTREAEAAAQLDHRNCVQVLAAGRTTDGMRFLVMPLLDGSELRREIKGGMPLRRVVDIVLQVLAGLEHAHSRGFIHRDVKPENVLLVADADGGEIAKLVDFGLVKPVTLARNDRALTAVGKVFGTPWYMAPEQAAGEHIDARADLYAVGMMMFEMLSGAPPFDGDSLAAVLHKHMFAELPALPTWLPTPIAALVRRLAAKRRDDRPSSAAEAAAALRRAVAQMSSQPTILPQLSIGDTELHSSRPDSMLRPSRGRATGVLVAIAATVLLAIGLPQLLGSTPGPTTSVETTAVASSAAEVWSATSKPTAAIAPTTVMPASPVIAAAAPVVVPDPVAPVDVTTAPSPRASGTDATEAPPRTKPVAKTPATKPARPVASTPVAKPSGPRKLESSRPPRTATAKLPGASAPGGLRREGGKLHLSPR